MKAAPVSSSVAPKRRRPCYQLVTKDAARVTALCGEPGVGKTSLLRAGLLPLLSQHNVATVYLGSYANFDQELWQALGACAANRPRRAKARPTTWSASHAPRRAGPCSCSTTWKTCWATTPTPASAAALPTLAALLKVAMAGSGSRLRLLLCIDGASFIAWSACTTSPPFRPRGRLDGAWPAGRGPGRRDPRTDRAQHRHVLRSRAGRPHGRGSVPNRGPACPPTCRSWPRPRSSSA
jgi:hypothetical protein